MNSKPDAKIVSWWDYGYQISGMSNRAVIVDNNTWNTTHIATVGAVFANEEEESYRLCRMLDAGFVLVIFGGYSAYSGDDINKFIWMIRIAGGYYPRIKEENFLKNGYRVDAGASDTMLNCMMYSFCYYRFDETKTQGNQETGYDLVRGYVIGRKNIKMRHFREAYTTENWIVRIYSVNELFPKYKHYNSNSKDSNYLSTEDEKENSESFTLTPDKFGKNGPQFKFSAKEVNIFNANKNDDDDEEEYAGLRSIKRKGTVQSTKVKINRSFKRFESFDSTYSCKSKLKSILKGSNCEELHKRRLNMDSGKKVSFGKTVYFY